MKIVVDKNEESSFVVRRGCILALLLSTVAFPGVAQNVNCDLKIDTATYSPRAISKPGYLQTITDPAFGTKVTRIVGDPGTPIPNIPGAVWNDRQERHQYSKVSAWNCDQSMLYLNMHDPVLWLDGKTYQVLFTRTKPGAALLWSHTEPHVMYHTGKPGNSHIGRWDVVKDVSTEVFDLRSYTDCSFGEGEGNFTWDGTKAAIYGKRISDHKFVVFVVDLVKKTKSPDVEVSDFDNCTMSPKGNYFLINDNNDFIDIYDAVNSRLVWSERRYGTPSHFDVQIDQNGDEVIAGVAKTAPYSGLMIKRRFSDGFITVLTNSGYASHTSGRNLKRPGWVFVTYQSLDRRIQNLPYVNEIDAVRLDGSRVERICNIRVNKYIFPTQKDQYRAESHGCPSPDGLRVIFASDWNKGTFPVQAFVADFRDKAIVPPPMNASEDRSNSGPSPVSIVPPSFASTAKITFTIPTGGRAFVRIFDLSGNLVATLFDEQVEAGKRQDVSFDGRQLSAGTYLAQLEYSGKRFISSMTIAR